MDLSKCKYCGSRTDVFYMFGESVCYDCAIELLKGYDYIKIDEKDGEDRFYVKNGSREEYEEYKSILELSRVVEHEENPFYDFCTYPVIEYSCRDIRCEEKVEYYLKNRLIECHNTLYSLYLWNDYKTNELTTLCTECLLKKLGVERISVQLKYEYCYEYFYIYFCEGKPIAAIKNKSSDWERENQLAKVIDYCIDNFNLRLELVEGVEYTDNYYKALDYNGMAQEHEFYKVISYRKLKQYTKEIKKLTKKKELNELKEFVRKSLNF